MKVLGYGDNVVDRYINRKVMYPGGNAVNFAVFAKKSGVEAAYLGVFGDDREADCIKSALLDVGVSISRCRTAPGTTTERCDVNLIDGDRVFVADDLRETKHGPYLLEPVDFDYLAGFDLIHSGCYASVETEIKKLKNLKANITFDFSVEEEFRNDAYLQLICPWIDMALFSCEGMDGDAISQLQKKVSAFGTKYVLTTMGTKGQSLFDGVRQYSGEVRLVRAVDTMGAGDSFFTSFSISLLKQGWKKNVRINQTKIEQAFLTAAEFSANNCLVDGAFGYGTHY